MLKIKFLNKESSAISILLFVLLVPLLLHFYMPASIQVEFTAQSDAVFQVYWAAAQQNYSERQSSRIYYNASQKKCTLPLPDLGKIAKLRIDPANKPSELVIKQILIKQSGYQTIRLKTPEALKTVRPIFDIQKYDVRQNGLSVTASGGDPQLELNIRPAVENRLRIYFNVGYILSILSATLLAISCIPLVDYILQMKQKVDKSLYPTMALSSDRLLKAGTLIAILGSAFLIVVIPVELSDSLKPYHFILYLAGIGVPLFFLSYFFLSRPFYQYPVQFRMSPQSWFWYAAPCYMVWTIYLLAFWPCSMSPDSLSQWNDALSGHFRDWHPAFHSMNFWLIAQLWRTPSAIAFTQIFFLGLTVAWGLRIIRKLGVPQIFIIISCLLLALSPVNGFMIITLWKDVAYSIAVFVLTLIVLQIVISDGRWLTKRRAWIFMGIILALTAIYRHNGLSVALGTPALLLMIYRKFRKELLFAFLLGSMLYVGIRGPLYSLLDIQRNLPKPTFKPKVAKYITPKKLVAPKTRSTPSDANQSLIPQAIDVLQYYADLGSTVWRIKPLEGRFKRTEYVNLWWESKDGIRYINSNKLGIKESSLFPKIRDYIFRQYLETISSPLKYFFWRPAFYLYIFLATIIMVAIRFGKWQFLLLPVPFICHLLPFFLISTSKAIFRYHYSIVLISMVLSIPLLFIKQPVIKTEAAHHS